MREQIQIKMETRPSVFTGHANARILQRKFSSGKESCCSARNDDENKFLNLKRKGHNLDRIDIQPKLTISEPDDMFEREAEAIASVVTKEHEGDEKKDTTGSLNISGNNSMIQRETEKEPEIETEGEEPTEEKLEEMEESNEGPLIQRKVEHGDESKKNNMMTVSKPAEGNQLDPHTRDYMESRFGYDFSHIRVHNDEHSNKAARAIHARAFTVGKNIWFANGEFSPGSSAGRRLLAHELVHTIQQGGEGRSIQRSICPGSCTSPVGKGRICRGKKVIRDNCGQSDAEDPDNKISHIRVTLGDRKVTLFWNGTPGKADGKTEEFGCTPNPGKTPKGWDRVGNKCGINHTSYERYNMAWFTAFASTGMRIGFHDSQPLGSGYRSHGCVRVSCENAKKINKNSKSDWTSIVVR